MNKTGFEKMQMSKPWRSRTFWLQRVLPVVLAVMAAFISRYQLELSDEVSAELLAGQWPVYAPVNALAAFCLTLVLFAVLGRWWLATGISGAAFTLIAVINYYTRDFHGSVLMPQDVRNLGTAANVMVSYRLGFPVPVRWIVAWVVPLAALVLAQYRLARGLPRRSSWRGRGVRVGVSAVLVWAILYGSYFSAAPLVPITHDFWSLQDVYNEYGYLAGTASATALLRDPIVQPEGYSAAAAQQAAGRVTGSALVEETDEYPDIVMILSESFYDLSLVTDLQTDKEVFPVTQGLENAIHGHTVSPQECGGTNNSEYELLTSNSLALMPSITPFNWLNLYGANSLVNYLEKLGYTTMAGHPYPQENYRRGSGWQALGFDQTYFYKDFPHCKTSYYGNRPFETDSATYQDFEQMYEAMPADQPRFAFLVSIQSHGDYNMNDDSLSLVHAGTDYGEYDHAVDEFLSCMRLSDAAIGQLCDYFTDLYHETGRKVIVALAGDHAPGIADHVLDAGLEEEHLLKRCTPFLIWANYPLENADLAISTTDPLNRMDMVMLAPTVLQQAGLPLSRYYQYLLEMKGQAPAFTNLWEFLTPTGKMGTSGEYPQAATWVQGYYQLEYNNVGAHAKRDQSLFDPLLSLQRK